MVERTIQILEPQFINLSESEQQFDPQKIAIPTKIYNIILLSPGNWNGLEFSAEEIKNAFELTDWHDKKNYELIKDHADKPLSVDAWVGYVRNQRLSDDGSLIGDLELWDESMIVKLVLAKAKFGISAKVLGMEMEGEFRNFTIANFSVVDSPACKDAYVNLSQKEELKEIRVYHTFDGEIELSQQINKERKRKDMQNTGKTSEVNGHSHGFNIDDEENGKTTSTIPEDHPSHTHQIVNSKVQETNDHIHTLSNSEEMAKVTDFEATRKKMGMSVSEFYAVPKDPPSSSKLPIFDAAHVRNALARFNQVQGLSTSEKATAMRKIRAAAKKFGVKVGKLEESNLIIIERRSKKMAKKELEENQEVEEETKEESEETEKEKSKDEEESKDEATEELSSKLDKILSEIQLVSKRVKKLEEATEESETKEEDTPAEEASEESPKEEDEEETKEELKEKNLSEEPNVLSVQELADTGGIPGRHTDGTLEMSAILKRLQ